MTDFEEYLAQQLKDPEFAAEWESLENVWIEELESILCTYSPG